MSVTNFATLKSTALVLAGREFDTGLSNSMNALVQMAEGRIRRDRRLRRVASQSPVAVTGATVQMPADLRAVRSFRLDGEPPLSQVSLEELQDHRARDGAAGKPRMCALEGRTLHVYPTPDQTYAARLSYEQGITALSDTNPTTWLLVSHPDVYLYYLLWEVGVYLKDQDMIDRYQARAVEAVESYHQTQQDLEMTHMAMPTPSRRGYGRMI